MPEIKLPNLGIKSGWNDGEDGWGAGMTQNLEMIDSLMHIGVDYYGVSNPPVAPANGDRYILGAAPTGVWGGSPYFVATYLNGDWRLYSPKLGMKAWVKSDEKFIYYSGTQWLDDPSGVEGPPGPPGPPGPGAVIQYATEAALLAAAPAANTVGYAVDTKKYYLRTSAPSWVYYGSALDDARMTATETKINGTISLIPKLVFSRRGIIDRRNFFGGGPAIYVSRNAFLGDSTIGTLMDLSLPADTKLSAFHKIVISDTVTLQAVYYDKTDAIMKVAVYPTLMPRDPNRYFHVVSVYGSSEAYASEMEFYNPREDSSSTFWTNDPLAWDPIERKLMVPRLYGFTPTGGWGVLPPTDTLYREVAVPIDNSFVWIDVADFITNGASSLTGIHVTSGYDVPTNPRPAIKSEYMILLGYVNDNKFTPCHPDCSLAPLVANECGYSREDNDISDNVYSDSAPVPLVRAESLALGFTRGYGSVNGRPFYGSKIKAPRNSGYCFVRFYLETDIENFFGNAGEVRVYLQGDVVGGGTVNNGYTPTLVKKISNFVREYQFTARLSAGHFFTSAWAGVFGSSGPSPIRVFGYQHYFGPEAQPYILRSDLPRANAEIGARLRALEAGGATGGLFEPMVPSRLYLHPDRPYNFYPDQMFGEVGRNSYDMYVTSRLGGNVGPIFNKELRANSFSLNDADLASTTDFVFSNLIGNRLKKTGFNVQTKFLDTADIAAVDAITLVIGDSLNNWNGCGVNTIARLRAMGATLTPIGTMNMTSEVTGDPASELGEARSGREFADFIYMNTDAMAPIANTGPAWAAYMGLDDTSKRAYNPFLKVPDSDDIANRSDMIKNGYIFDFGFYLTRSGQPIPDLVNINLHTNDISQQDPATSLLQIKEGLRIMVSQIRRACPNAHIPLGYNAYGRQANEDRWKTEHWAGLKAMFEFVRNLGDTKVAIVPAYCTVNRDTGFKYTYTTDVYGARQYTLDDSTHYAEDGVKEYAETNAQFWAGMLTNA